jgi:hypothetical protein
VLSSQAEYRSRQGQNSVNCHADAVCILTVK